MNHERLLQRFLNYVTCTSESFREERFCRLLEEEFSMLGVSWERQEIGEMFGSNGWNIHASLPGDGAPILLCAHLDTAAPGDSINPAVKDGVISSDGTTVLGADNKAGVAAALEAVQTIVEKKLPHYPVELLFTICGEAEMLGAKYADYRNIISKEAVVLDGEAGCGVLCCTPWYSVLHFSVLGKTAHAGICPEQGSNALKTASDCISCISCGRVSRNTTVNIANLLCPGQSNAVSALATFDVDIRSFDEKEFRAAVNDICQCVRETCLKWGTSYHAIEEQITKKKHLSLDTSFAHRVFAALHAVGMQMQLQDILGVGDSVYLAQNGIDTICVGAGVKEPHTLNESVRFSDIAATADFLIRLLTE